jgi:hypothetical protein
VGLVWSVLTLLSALLELLWVLFVTRVLNVLPLLSSILPQSALMDIVLLLSELLEMLAQLLLTVLLEFAPVLDALEKLTEPLAQTLANADLVHIAMELAWPMLPLVDLAPVENNVEDLEIATTELALSSTPFPLDLSAMTPKLVCSDITVELAEPALPTPMLLLVPLILTVLLLELTPSACALELEPRFALKEPDSLLTVPPLSLLS